MYPVTYEADYLRERNRLTTFFRPIVAIPWLIVAYVYGIAALVVVVIAWFALLITGKYPQGMYNFVGGVTRYSMRANAFMTLQTDEWPPFGISDDPSYPVRINFAPRAASQSRLKTLFRIVLLVPIVALAYAVALMQSGVTLISWLTIVFRGYQPAAMHNALAWLNGWNTRASAYSQLMRDEYPTVGDETPVEVDPPAPDEIDAVGVAEPAPLDPGTPDSSGLDAPEATPGDETGPPPTQ